MKKILFWAVIMLFAACGRIIKVSDLQYKEGERAVLSAQRNRPYFYVANQIIGSFLALFNC